MQSDLLKFLLLMYAAIEVFNAGISTYLWAKTRSRLYRHLALAWISGVFTLIFQGATAQHGELIISLGAATQIFFTLQFGLLFADTVGFTIPIRKFVWTTIGSCVLAVVFWFFGLGFPYLGVTCIAADLPTLYVGWIALTRYRETLSFTQRAIAVFGLLWFAHGLDYPFLRMVDSFAPVGFTIATLLAFALSVFALAMVSESLAWKVAKVEGDMAVTGEVQALFLPSKPEFTSNSLQVASYYQSAVKSGGDWWWHDTLADGRQIFLIGDVTGHGPGPAMITGVMASSFLTLKDLQPNLKLEQILPVLNRTLRLLSKERYFMTLTALEISADCQTLNWGGAGAPPIYVQRAGGATEVLQEASSPLGRKEAEYKIHTFSLGRGDRIFAFTDGIYEFGVGRAGQPFGLRKLQNLVGAHKGGSAQEAREKIIGQIMKEHGGGPLQDDMAFVLIETV